MRLVGLQWTRLPPRFPPVFSRLVQTEREPAKAKVRFVVHGAADEKNHEWGGQGRSSLIAPTSPIEPTLDGKKPRPYIRFVSLERPGSTQESQNNISKKVIGPVPETHTRREEVREEARVVLSDTQGQRSLFQKILTTAKYRRRLETKGKSVEQITASQKTSANSQAESTASQRANGVSKRSRKRKSKSRPLVRLAYPKEDAAPNETSISTGETTKSSTSISHDTSSTGSGTRESKDGTGQIRIVKVRNRRSSKHTSVSGSNEGDLHHSKTKDQEQSIQSGHTDNMRKSKVTIDALLQSITKPKPLISPKGLQTSLEQSAPSTTPPPDTPAKHLPAEDVGAVNHILCLENCGFTMIKSDIERIFSNHEALVRGWQIYGMDLTLIVPGRTRRLQRRNRYYLYFRSRESMKYHLQYFAGFHRSSDTINWNAITLPPSSTPPTPAAPNSDTSDVIPDPTAIVPLEPKLEVVPFSREGAVPNILYEGGGAPGRTAIVTLCAHTEWQYLQVWLRYDVLEKGKFGRYMVSGGDNSGNGLQMLPTTAGTTGGKWLVRFQVASEAERLVREWDGKWVKVRGKVGVMRVELVW